MRNRDLIWDALVAACGADMSEMTKNERGRYNAAVKQLKEAGATPEEIGKRARAFQREYPGLNITPMALVTNWSRLRERRTHPVPLNPPSGPAPAAQCSHGNPDDGSCPECRKRGLELLGKMRAGVFKGPPDDV